MTEAGENWILFEGSFVVPASLGVSVLSKAISVNRPYNKPMEISHDSMSFRLITDEEITTMRARQKILE